MTAPLSPTPQLLAAHSKDLGGGLVVRRLLPAAQRQAVGPFIFFDHFGPVTITPADNHDVRAHPHIGYTQRIEPGAINWMTAGSGIVQAGRDWTAGDASVGMGQVPGETERIPLPERTRPA